MIFKLNTSKSIEIATETAINLSFKNYSVVGPLIDKDGNIYTTIIIGNQEWIVENYRTTTYADGTAIPNITLAMGTWMTLTTGAYCWYNDDSITYNDYGLLYNWYAVNSASGLAYLERDRVEELGWRIPTLADFNTLIAFLGGTALAGGPLKEIGLTHWASPNTGATNSTGFTGLPGGVRFGTFSTITTKGYYYSSEINESGGPYYIELWSANIQGNTWSDTGIIYQKGGQSIRLVRDI